MLDDSRTPEPSAMPLGWHISVYRQQNDGSSPASFGAGQGPRLAVWQTGLDGLRWLDDLVKQKNAIDLGGNGYPIEYTAMAATSFREFATTLLKRRRFGASTPEDIIMPQWLGKTTKDPQTMDACRPDEWLIIRAWDES